MKNCVFVFVSFGAWWGTLTKRISFFVFWFLWRLEKNAKFFCRAWWRVVVKKKICFMFFLVKLGEELQWKENLLCCFGFLWSLLRSYDRKLTFFLFSFLRSGGKEKAFYRTSKKLWYKENVICVLWCETFKAFSILMFSKFSILVACGFYHLVWTPWGIKRMIMDDLKTWTITKFKLKFCFFFMFLFNFQATIVYHIQRKI
jgi:hypothetical protein